jgi:hypothetical protein
VGFAMGCVVWLAFKTPAIHIVGSVTVYGERLGPWHDAKAAVVAIGGICTLCSWAILAWISLSKRAATRHGADSPEPVIPGGLAKTLRDPHENVEVKCPHCLTTNRALVGATKLRCGRCRQTFNV